MNYQHSSLNNSSIRGGPPPQFYLTTSSSTSSTLNPMIAHSAWVARPGSAAPASVSAAPPPQVFFSQHYPVQQPPGYNLGAVSVNELVTPGRAKTVYATSAAQLSSSSVAQPPYGLVSAPPGSQLRPFLPLVTSNSGSNHANSNGYRGTDIMSPASVHLGVANGHAPALDGPLGASSGHTTNEDIGIREVWAHNMDEEFKTICQIIQRYHFVAMDTEFPGVVARPIGEFKSTADYQYQLLRCNVDLLKIIQLGLTFFDDKGQLPEAGPSTWQFNFKFNLTEDMYAEDSVDLLQSSGIQFEKHEQDGIDPIHFAEMMLISGLVLMEPVKWLSFHSGYDFGYLLNLLTNQNLPKTEAEFFELLKLYFPNVYDVKYLMKSCKNLKGGLQEVANELEVQRIGPQHQAGSDSLLTGQTFFKMKEMFFEDDIDDSKYCGHLYGLGTNFVVGNNKNSNSSTPAVALAASEAATSTSSTATTTASKSDGAENDADGDKKGDKKSADNGENSASS